MGLFDNKKKLCPVCGNSTPRLLATKVEGMPICKECADKVDLPTEALDSMSLEAFEQYIAYYDENQGLRERFSESYSYMFGFIAGTIRLDATHRWFRLKGYDSALVMEASHLESFRILEDNRPLFESGPNVLRCYESDVPERISAMSSQIAQFAMELRRYEMMEKMERLHDKDDERRTSLSRPYFEMPTPFQHFCVELNLNHPYWKTCRWEIDAPTVDPYRPSAQSYMNDYQAKVDELHVLAMNLIQIKYPGAQEVREGGYTSYGAPAAPFADMTNAVPGVDAVEEIKKYKDLLDAGIITADEFAAKKRQLLGI